MTPETWNQIEKGGIIFLLCLNIYLYWHGDIFSKPTVERMLKYGNDQARIVASEIVGKMNAAVTTGVLQAVVQIREMTPVTKALKKKLDEQQKEGGTA